QVIVLEATGGYEASVVAALGLAGLLVAVVNPRHGRCRQSQWAAGEGRPVGRAGARSFRCCPAPRAASVAGCASAGVGSAGGAAAPAGGAAYGGASAVGGNACPACARPHPGASGMVGRGGGDPGYSPAPPGPSEPAVACARQPAAERPRDWSSHRARALDG